ncbi:MAG: ABC transporter permease subunit [Acidimicrobiales bacterium]
MRALLAGELRRLLSRRMIKVLALLALLGIAIGGVATFLKTEQTSEAVLRQRRVAAEARVADCVQGAQPPPGLALSPNGKGGPSAANQEEFCQFRFGRVPDRRLKLEKLEGVLQGLTAPLVIVAWVVGASSIGAELQARSITTLLTWEPRRVRVMVVKVVAAVIVTWVFSLVTWALLSASLLPAVFVHGTTAGTDAAWWRSTVAVVARGELMIAVATSVGFAVASIGRNTAAALGVGFAYFLVIENVVGNFLAGFRRWLLLGNAIVLISGKDSGGEVVGRSVLVAGLYLTGVAVTLLVVATVLFGRRDIA